MDVVGGADGREPRPDPTEELDIEELQRHRPYGPGDRRTTVDHASNDRWPLPFRFGYRPLTATAMGVPAVSRSHEAKASGQDEIVIWGNVGVGHDTSMPDGTPRELLNVTRLRGIELATTEPPIADRGAAT